MLNRISFFICQKKGALADSLNAIRPEPFCCCFLLRFRLLKRSGLMVWLIGYCKFTQGPWPTAINSGLKWSNSAFILDSLSGLATRSRPIDDTSSCQLLSIFWPWASPKRNIKSLLKNMPLLCSMNRSPSCRWISDGYPTQVKAKSLPIKVSPFFLGIAFPV